MALRLRRDVQKASYYVWFLGAEEAKGLRGARVINSALPYLIDRSSRGQEPLKVTLQVSHKGIKIVQGSSKHFIPHSAITSSVQTDDIVACVLLLYNPATKCPLHVHAYRCDSETTAEALNQQLQILINRPENQKRFEELETRLGILPPLPVSKSGSSHHLALEQKKHGYPTKVQQPPPHGHATAPPHQQQRRHETSPKRFNSSLGSDTGNSTRESECSEEHSGDSPLSRSPPIAKALPLPPQANNELFDSLAAELRAKLNGNGPPLLLPPRDYDTVHRSKGNLAAIELRRCRNALIVGSTTPKTGTANTTVATAITANGKQVSSRGSSGIGSDLAPSPERQEINSSSDDEQWSNEADNSVIALKPSQIPIDRPVPIIPHHPQLNRKQPPGDNYLRDLPAKPYSPRADTTNNNIGNKVKATASNSTPWSREDEIKPIIVRPIDYDAKFNRILQAEQKQIHPRRSEHGVVPVSGRGEHAKLRDTDKYNEINRLLSKKLSLERASPERECERRYNHDNSDDFDESDPPSDHIKPSSSYRRENLTDKQKFLEYTSKKHSKAYTAEEQQKYGGRQRYVDPADLPFEQPGRNKYAAVHRGPPSPERQIDREREREHPELSHRHRTTERRDKDAVRRHSPEREHFSRSSERNPYREPESIPYIESMEKMMKSSAMRYKEPIEVSKEDAHIKVTQRSKSYPKHEEELSKPTRDYNYNRNRPEYAGSTSSNHTPKDRFRDAKDKFRAMERSNSRFDLTNEQVDKNAIDYKPRRHGSVEPVDNVRYEDWSDEDRRLADSPPPPPPPHRSRSRSHDQWDQSNILRYEQDVRDAREARETRYPRDYGRGVEVLPRDTRRDHSRDAYRDASRYEPRTTEHHPQRVRESSHEYVREERRHRDYSPDIRSGADHPRADYPNGRPIDAKQRMPHPDIYPPANGAVVPNAKNLSNMSKGYRHSYAEPMFARSGGRVGLAAVNPY